MDYSEFNVTSLGGNCIAADLNFGKKSPLNGAWAKRGILSIECIFNNQFKDTLTRYNEFVSQSDMRNKVYVRKNLQEFAHQTEYITLISDYEFGHIDLSIEENRNKILNRFPAITSTNKFFYSLNDYDCLYITENNIKNVLYILDTYNIQSKDIVILESSCYNQDDKINFWKNYINPVFSKYFTVYRIDYTNENWKELANQFLANYFSE